MSVLLGFGRGGTAVPHLLQGWSAPEDNFTWSLGTRSALRVDLPAEAGEAFLELAVNPYTEPDGPPRRLTVLG
jgi:hypothetical protein